MLQPEGGREALVGHDERALHAALDATRPTAVNLAWALDEMQRAVRNQKRENRVAVAYARAAALNPRDPAIRRALLGGGGVDGGEGEHGVGVVEHEKRALLPFGLFLVVRNLLANAVLYTPAGGTVRVTLEGSTSFDRIVVAVQKVRSDGTIGVTYYDLRTLQPADATTLPTSTTLTITLSTPTSDSPSASGESAKQIGFSCAAATSTAAPA